MPMSYLDCIIDRYRYSPLVSSIEKQSRHNYNAHLESPGTKVFMNGPPTWYIIYVCVGGVGVGGVGEQNFKGFS